MKKIAALLFLLSGFFASVTVATEVKMGENPIVFSVIPEIYDISCGEMPFSAIYTVKNTDKSATIWVTPDTIIVYDDFPDDLVTIQKPGSGSFTTCDKTYLKPGATCNINLIITPAACGEDDLLGPVDRLLVVATGTQYKNPTAPIEFAYTEEGGGNAFAILGAEVYNYGGPSDVVGSVGHTNPAVDIVGPFEVSGGEFYASATDPAVLSAYEGFYDLYERFIDNKENCRIHSDITPPTELQAAYYCLTTNSGLDEVTVTGPIVLSGNGNFVFFVDDGQDSCFPNVTAGAPCNLHIESTTTFFYKNGASASNVYWLTGNGGEVQIESGAELDGALLSGGSISTSPNGPSPASVIGQLWSLDSSITLYGDSVAIHD